ncbi:MAG: L,D-transpeptidase family protein [Sphingobium sp.]
MAFMLLSSSRALASMALILLLPNAGMATQPLTSVARLAPGTYRWMEADVAAGPIYMIVSLKAQLVHVYSGDRLIGAASVSTGKPGKATPGGEFTVLQKRQWHRSNLYSNAPMPFMQRLTWDGIALHAGHNPGYPASHGCIRLPRAFAQRLFELTRIGTLVEVTPDRLAPMLKLDPLVTTDADHRVVSFAPAGGAPVAAMPVGQDAVPYLDIDPGIFGPII